MVSVAVASTHTLKIDTCPLEPSLDDRLKRFWELESLGITQNEASPYDKFVQRIKFDGQRYDVNLGWKEYHPPLPDHLNLCRGLTTISIDWSHPRGSQRAEISYTLTRNHEKSQEIMNHKSEITYKSRVRNQKISSVPAQARSVYLRAMS